MKKPYITLSTEQLETLLKIARLHGSTETDVYPTETMLVEFDSWRPSDDVAIQSGVVTSAGRVHPRNDREAA